MVNAPALAAAIGGPVVGLAGVLFAWLNSTGERAHGAALAREQHEHERKLAQGERLFEKKSDAYLRLLRHLQRVMLVVERRNPVIGPRPDPPEMPSEEEWNEMLVHVAAFGSEEASRTFEEFATRVNSFQMHAGHYEAMRDHGGDFADSAQRMNEVREECRERFRGIEQMVRDELAGL